ncbi:hypothetical protein [Mucilaginibacter terrae]|uniref:Uncharacterized protein n=1 Tax=Mucilaginibacter terrae TaxID=1955052 RepID=A0ABU3GXX7_9SPHI|nr:hypothetical protein [Mucilaginibacter terrae]MDT3404629.1 hypothetical protein [Mucilaginibacter terrae]
MTNFATNYTVQSTNGIICYVKLHFFYTNGIDTFPIAIDLRK